MISSVVFKLEGKMGEDITVGSTFYLSKAFLVY